MVVASSDKRSPLNPDSSKWKNMRSVPGITLPLLNLDFARKRPSHENPNVYSKEELKLKSNPKRNLSVPK